MAEKNSFPVAANTDSRQQLQRLANNFELQQEQQDGKDSSTPKQGSEALGFSPAVLQ